MTQLEEGSEQQGTAPPGREARRPFLKALSALNTKHQTLNTALPILAGPTAVGKTALSLEWAEANDAEIVSCDSRQVYRELTIGTAKPSPAEQARVPHHFIDERSVSEPLSAGRFEALALERIRAIQARGRNVLVTGGSTLYVHALLEGLADIPAVDPAIRPRLVRRLETEGADALYAELQRADPAFAETLDPTKSQRLLRGLE
ncbi:MAG: tRNA (adenosine(37)-N6)-dimethylallyltransferase MiaA, partial [Bacteroidota bacterium]